MCMLSEPFQEEMRKPTENIKCLCFTAASSALMRWLGRVPPAQGHCGTSIQDLATAFPGRLGLWGRGLCSKCQGPAWAGSPFLKGHSPPGPGHWRWRWLCPCSGGLWTWGRAGPLALDCRWSKQPPRCRCWWRHPHPWLSPASRKCLEGRRADEWAPCPPSANFSLTLFWNPERFHPARQFGPTFPSHQRLLVAAHFPFSPSSLET